MDTETKLGIVFGWLGAAVITTLVLSGVTLGIVITHTHGTATNV